MRRVRESGIKKRKEDGLSGEYPVIDANQNQFINLTEKRDARQTRAPLHANRVLDTLSRTYRISSNHFIVFS